MTSAEIENQSSHLLLVPGLACDFALWERQVVALTELGFRCTVADVTQGASIDAMAARLLAEAPDHFHLGGLSMGGYISMAIARQAPERVLSMTLVATSARVDTDELTAKRRELVDLALQGQFESVLDTLIPRFVGESNLDDDRLKERVKDMARRIGPNAFAVQQHAIMHRPDSRPSLRAMPMPSLVICGDEDVLTPPHLSEEIAELLPNSAFELIKSCGHLATMEAAAEVAFLMSSFLRR